MCGIAGVYSFNKEGESSLKKIDTALQKIKHRGPDSQGTYFHNNVGLGHVRLSIIDTSDKGFQPLTDISGRYTIVFNGEFYNYKEHRNELINKGISFTSETDTEVLLNLYIQEGEKCLDKINGFFAFAIYDKEEESLFIARDRIGIKPLYVCYSEKKMVFCSEIKGLMKLGVNQSIDKISLFSYLQLNYIPGPNSILQGVKKLNPGTFLKIVKNGNEIDIKNEQYYTIPLKKNAISNLSSSAYQRAQNKLKTLLDDAVKNRLVSDVPLGTFLSGGIDSSVLTGIASKYIKDLKTFSIGYKNEPIYDETQYANLVAEKFKTDHTVFSLSNDDLFENLDAILDSFDEPFADSSSIAVNILSKLTKQKVSVILSGDGADEMFSGYNKHEAEFKARNMLLYKKGFSMLAPFLSVLPKSRNNPLGNKVRKLHKFSKGIALTNKERYWQWASLTSEEEANFLLLEKFIFKEQRLSDDAYQYKKRKENWLSAINKEGDFNEILYSDMKLVLVNDMLTKVDSMSMAHSLEVRTPFLDHNVVDFAFSLPFEFKINASMRKKILQDTYRNDLPAELFNRPKHGFEVPLVKWLRTELKSRIETQYLNNEFIREQKIFNPDAIEKIKKKLFSANTEDSPATVWALIVFQHWWIKNIGN